MSQDPLPMSNNYLQRASYQSVEQKANQSSIKKRAQRDEVINDKEVFQQMILQQMHLMQQSQTRMFKKVFEQQNELKKEVNGLKLEAGQNMNRNNAGQNRRVDRVGNQGRKTEVFQLLKERKVNQAYDFLVSELLQNGNNEECLLERILQEEVEDDEALTCLIRLMGKTGVCSNLLKEPV